MTWKIFFLFYNIDKIDGVMTTKLELNFIIKKLQTPFLK